MLVVIILSFINSGDMVEVCSVHACEEEHFTYAYVYGKWYIFHSFLALNSTHIISEVTNLTSTFVLMLIVIILSFINSSYMVEVCSVHVRMSISHMHTFTANGTYFISFWHSILHISSLIEAPNYIFHSFLALNSTHIISEVPNLISTFVLLLIVIILGFINPCDMVEVCSVHARKSISHMRTFMANATHFIAFWLSILHISSQKFQI